MKRRLAHAVTALGVVLALTGTVRAEVPDSLGICGATPPPPGADPVVPLQGTVKACFIFARFSDENTEGGDWLCNPETWPIGDPANDPIPSWGNDLLSWSAPGPPGSLTHFFYEMSGGQHELVGEAYPRVIHLEPAINYWTGGSTVWNGVNRALVDSVAADTVFDLGRFANASNEIEYIFVVMRNKSAESSAYMLGITGDSHLFSGPLKTFDVGGTTYTVTFENGSALGPFFRSRGYKTTFGLAVHEYGHDLIPQQDLLTPGHVRSMGPYGIMDGTVLHTGGGNGDGGGLMSTVHRREIGWLNDAAAQVIDVGAMSPGDSLRIELTDVGTTGEAGYAVVRTLDPEQYFVLECRDSTASPYTDGTFFDAVACSVRTGYSGLLVAHVSERQQHSELHCIPTINPPGGWWGAVNLNTPVPWTCSPPGCVCEVPLDPCPDEVVPPELDIELATGMFDVIGWQPDAIAGYDAMSSFDGENTPQGVWKPTDLFRPGNVSSFTPYTNPSTNLYWLPTSGDYYDLANCPLRQRQDQYSGISLLNIDWITPPGNGLGKIAVTIRYDGPEPTGPLEIAPNTVWDGLVQLTSDVVVPAGVTLTVREGTEIRVAAAQDARGTEDPTRVEILVEGTIAFQGTAPGAVLVHSSRDGEIEAFPGEFETMSPAAGDWVGFRLASGASIALDPGASAGVVEIRHAEGGINYETSVFPDLAADGIDKIAFTNNGADVTFDRTVTVPAAASRHIPGPLVVELRDDLIVPSGTTLSIDPGAELRALAGQGVEVQVAGVLNADGQDGLPVLFTSTSTQSGSWDGIRFLDDSDMRTSRLDYAEIEYPVFGVQVDSLAGTLFKPKFTGTLTADIYVDRDTNISSGEQWVLEAPCTVKMLADDDLGGTGGAGGGEDPDRCEFLVSGRIETYRPVGGSGVVEFTSTAADAVFGDDWYGMTVAGTGFSGDGKGVADISDADFGYAVLPLSFWVADTASVASTHFHHYAEDAITDWASESVISDCFIERGGSLNIGTGLTGIHTFESFATAIRDTITSQESYGIWVEGSKQHCLLALPPAPPDTVLISELVAVGNDPPEPGTTGVRVNWSCHEQVTLIEESDVQLWDDGVRIQNSADVVVRCNCLSFNRAGVAHSRATLTLADDPGVTRLRQNNLFKNDSTNVEAGQGPAGTAAIYTGVTGSGVDGENRLVRAGTNATNYNYKIKTAQFGRVDSAHVNRWFQESGGTIPALDVNDYNFFQDVLEQGIEIDDANIGVDPSCSSDPTDCDGLPVSPGAQRIPRTAHVVTEPSVPEGAVEDAGDPVRLRIASQSVGAKSTILELDISSVDPRPVSITVYDVTGRRVRDVHNGVLAPGSHRLLWDLTQDSGRPVASGMYFVRVASGDVREVRKVVVTR
ncbi:MAG: T9SS type A sorting domain-containing protein [bacterium]